MKGTKNIVQKVDEELSQAIARLIVSSLVILIMFFSYIIEEAFSLEAIILNGFYIVYSLFNLYVVHIKPGDYPGRKIANIAGDTGILSYAIYASSPVAIIFYPVLLWVIVGNGLRFGIKYLFTALAFAEVFFTSALLFNTNWHDQKSFIFALSLGLAGLSFFFAKLIKRMHTLNETLEEKVKERVAEVEYRYLHDPLTELKNREALDHDLQKNTFGGIIVVDIDQFHNYNDLYGMYTGDEVLKHFAKFLHTFAEVNGYEAYRIYSDHFVLRNTTGRVLHPKYEADMEALFSQISHFKIELDDVDEALEPEITAGISLEREKALKKAEMALAYAKKNNMSYIAYSKVVDSSTMSQELLYWRKEIKKALITNNILPVFQPLVNRQQEVVKYEALMRLRRVENGKVELVSPFFFLEIAFKSKQYEKLTKVMIDKSFEFISTVSYDVSINLSFEDIVNKTIKEKLKTNIQKYGIANQVIFEIVESTNIDDFKQVQVFIAEFQNLGVRIAIDDFGSGYSNFANIMELGPDYLKIDGSLIKNIDTDKKSYMLVSAIASMAQQLGIKTIAEFVSKKEIFDICYELGIDYFQGYYFSEPLLKEKIEENINSKMSGGQGGIRTLGTVASTHP